MLFGALITMAFLPPMPIACVAGIPWLLGISLICYLKLPARTGWPALPRCRGKGFRLNL